MADMTITTGTKTRTEYVTDLDIGFISGDMRSFTLHSEDSYDITERTIAIHTQKPVEKMIVFQSAVAWISERPRLVEIDETPSEDAS